MLASHATRVISHKKQDIFGVDRGAVAEQRHATSQSFPVSPRLPSYPFTPSHDIINTIVDAGFS
jgi:hypothetical protein